MRKLILLLGLVALLGGSCSDDTTAPGQGAAGDDEIYSGGVPRDGIPALIDPEFIEVEQASYLSNADLVLGVIVEGEARAYPIDIMNYHEIANDHFQGRPVCVTYCPLTGSGVVYASVLGGQEVQYGVSGLLFRNNLIPYDRTSSSLYSQMYVRGIRGDYRDFDWQLYPSLQCTWRFWKDHYPDTKVMSINTGYSRDYTSSPYGNYHVSYSTLFPVRFPDNRYHPKHLTLGVQFDGQAMAFPSSELFNEKVINLDFADKPLVIVYDANGKYIGAYSRIAGDDTLSFSLNGNSSFSTTMIDDQTGSIWSATGLATDGSMAGEKLDQFPFYTAYWFAWHDFYPETEVYTPSE
jgi:hypothetical protein